MFKIVDSRTAPFLPETSVEIRTLTLALSQREREIRVCLV
jgi:hypothetical protein